MTETVQLTFTQEDMRVLDLALVELPYKMAAPLINKINEQIKVKKGQQKPGNVRDISGLVSGGPATVEFVTSRDA